MRINKKMTDYAVERGLEWKISYGHNPDEPNAFHLVEENGYHLSQPQVIGKTESQARNTIRNAAHEKLKKHKFHEKHLCQYCGCKFEDHRAADHLCPPTTSWGVAKSFPRLTQTKDPDKAASDYWAKSDTKFSPV